MCPAAAPLPSCRVRNKGPRHRQPFHRVSSDTHTNHPTRHPSTHQFNKEKLPRFLFALIAGGIFAFVLCEQFNLSRALAVPIGLFICVQLQNRGLL